MKRVLVALLLLGAVAVLVPVLAPGLLLHLAVAIERNAAGLARQSATVGDAEIAYLDGGSGEPLLLLHGFGADKDNWTRAARYLTPHLRVIAPDLPPFGESRDREGASYSVSAQIERVRAFADHLGLERFHLGGNSMGGGIAGFYAARYPEQVLSLWLVAPGGVRSAEQSELERRLEAGENPLLVSSPDEFRALMKFAMEEPPYIPGPVVRHLTSVAIDQRQVHQKVFDELWRTRNDGSLSLEEELAGSAMPTLITWGNRDRLLHVSGAATLASVMESATVQVFENVGHLPMIERPEESAAALVALLRGQTR